MSFTLDEAIALADSAHRGAVDTGRPRGGDHQRAVRRLVQAAGYGPAHQMTAVLHEDDEASGVGPDLLARARARGAPPEVVAALESVTRRPDPDAPDDWEPYLSGLISRAAANDIGRVVKLFDGVVSMLHWHAEGSPGALRSQIEYRYRPAQAILLAAEASRRAEGLVGPFPVERAAFLRYAIALDTRVRANDRFGALAARLEALGHDDGLGTALGEGYAAS